MTPGTEVILQLFAFVWGAVWGSFLNVVIYRLPRDMSVSYPPSRCGACLTRIRWYDNVPVFSYLALRGRCRTCKSSYGPRYMLVEAATGLLVLVLMRAVVLPPNPDTFITDLLTWIWLQAFVYALIAITFIDLEHTFIPDEISYPMILVGLIGAFSLPGLDSLAYFWGAIGGAFFILLVAGVGWLVFRREAMGLGDVKLLALIGAFLGWRALPFVLFASAAQALLAAGVAALYTRVTGRANQLTMTTEQLDERFGETGLYDDLDSRVVIPYGPFLALAALEALLFGDELLFDLVRAITG